MKLRPTADCKLRTGPRCTTISYCSTAPKIQLHVTWSETVDCLFRWITAAPQKHGWSRWLCCSWLMRGHEGWSQSWGMTARAVPVWALKTSTPLRPAASSVARERLLFSAFPECWWLSVAVSVMIWTLSKNRFGFLSLSWHGTHKHVKDF